MTCENYLKGLNDVLSFAKDYKDLFPYGGTVTDDPIIIADFGIDECNYTGIEEKHFMINGWGTPIHIENITNIRYNNIVNDICVIRIDFNDYDDCFIEINLNKKDKSITYNVGAGDDIFTGLDFGGLREEVRSHFGC